MNRGKTISPAEIDFWVDLDQYGNFLEERIDSSNKTLIFSIDMIRLSSIRKAISNFVRILTNKCIPVYFNDVDANVNFGGKIIYISAQINSKQDFDVAIGQALHEGAHTLKTDFDIVKNAWANIPSSILKLSDSKNIRRSSLEKFIHKMWNVIEDRFIDNYIFNEAPGYRGYYVALYDRFWNCPYVDELLLSDMYRYPSLYSYDFRITNFTNLNTDLLALPKLEEIARIIDISHIDRLERTKDRLVTAFKLVETVLDCLDKETPLKTIKKKSDEKLADPRDYFDFGDESDDSGKPEENNQEVDVGKKMIDEISDILGDRDSEPEKMNENHDIVNRISVELEIEKNIQKQIDNVIESQRKFIAGEFPKENVIAQEKELLNLIEKHGIILVQVKMPKILSGDDKNLKVNCIVVQKMTKELILSGMDVFPLCGVMKLGTDTPTPPKDVDDAVKKGIIIGIKLGRKLQIRAEVNPIKIIRKRYGKINKRQIHEAAFDAEDLFYKIKVDEYQDAILHISVDASGSMKGKKWLKTMTSVVAICKAASMIDNIHVTVSFRSTQVSANTSLPYIILAYNSKIDNFSKIRNLFPYLSPNGFTPEGLAFSAIMNLFDEITPDEKDRYFLNLSDGEPFYNIRVPSSGFTVSYTDDVGVIHTKAQVDKIRSHGVEILSYFIDENLNKKSKDIEKSPLCKNFRKMYGKNARIIDVNNVLDLSRTINELFLKRRN